MLQSAFGITAGIGVDVHTHRISERLGWTKNCKNPEVTRKQLESFVPKYLWPQINHLLVGFGQTICLPKKPQCFKCKLATNNLCPYYIENKDLMF